MEDRLKIITEDNVKILFVDFSNLKQDEILKLYPEMNEKAISNGIKYFILDISETHTNQEIKDASKVSIQEIESKVGKVTTALIGLSGIQKVIANAINNGQYFAKDYSDAVRWLIEKSQN